jgi:hypothetical protein
MVRRKEKPHDFSVIAHRVVREATHQNTEPEKVEAKKPDYAALGRLGSKKGGKARAKMLSPERRKEIARKAAQVSWARA